MHTLEAATLILGLIIAGDFIKGRLNLDDNSPVWVWIGWIFGTFFVGFAAFQVIAGVQRRQYALLYPWAVILVVAMSFLAYRAVRGMVQLLTQRRNGRRQSSHHLK